LRQIATPLAIAGNACLNGRYRTERRLAAGSVQKRPCWASIIISRRASQSCAAVAARSSLLVSFGKRSPPRLAVCVIKGS
jgi:hypothetical protein